MQKMFKKGKYIIYFILKKYFNILKKQNWDGGEFIFFYGVLSRIESISDFFLGIYCVNIQNYYFILDRFVMEILSIRVRL